MAPDPGKGAPCSQTGHNGAVSHNEVPKMWHGMPSHSLQSLDAITDVDRTLVPPQCTWATSCVLFLSKESPFRDHLPSLRGRDAMEDDDLLREQDAFLSAGGQPAARAIRVVRKKREGNAELKDEQQKGKIEIDESHVPVLNSTHMGAFVGEILEKNLGEESFQPPSASTSAPTSGFPVAQHRSKFKLQLARRDKIAEGLSAPSTSSTGASNDPELDQISRENEAKLAHMTEDEIKRAQEVKRSRYFHHFLLGIGSLLHVLHCNIRAPSPSSSLERRIIFRLAQLQEIMARFSPAAIDALRRRSASRASAPGESAAAPASASPVAPPLRVADPSPTSAQQPPAPEDHPPPSYDSSPPAVPLAARARFSADGSLASWAPALGLPPSVLSGALARMGAAPGTARHASLMRLYADLTVPPEEVLKRDILRCVSSGADVLRCISSGAHRAFAWKCGNGLGGRRRLQGADVLSVSHLLSMPPLALPLLILLPAPPPLLPSSPYPLSILSTSLHRSAAEPGAAVGYSIPEAIVLLRSAHPQHRVAALSLIASVTAPGRPGVADASEGEAGVTLGDAPGLTWLPGEGFEYVAGSPERLGALRAALDDDSPSVAAAAAR